jgi:hypothetical protein
LESLLVVVIATTFDFCQGLGQATQNSQVEPESPLPKTFWHSEPKDRSSQTTVLGEFKKRSFKTQQI